MKYDWLIVGAGFTGAVLAERIASQLGHKVLIIDRRDHIGGNAFDYYDENGVLIHKYGPHIFHTNSHKVWDYISKFTSWRPYEHHVLGMVDGKMVPIPFNLNSLVMIFGHQRSYKITDALIREYGFGSNVPILRMLESSDSSVRELAKFIYDNVFLCYTRKQWGMNPDDLDPSVTGRVPVRISFDNRYFQDSYQAMPLDGYTAMFSRMLDHPNIEIRLGVDYRNITDSYDRLIYTGSIDEYFDYRYGPLPYRTTRFVFDHLPRCGKMLFPVGTINYPSELVSFTRVTEFKHLTGQTNVSGTTLVYEYPQAHTSSTEPYYPIPRDENQQLYALYKREAEKSRVWFAGRLGDYRYYNMDQAVARALKLFNDIARSSS